MGTNVIGDQWHASRGLLEVDQSANYANNTYLEP